MLNLSAILPAVLSNTVLKPRWPLAVLDTGDPTRQGAGWYDVQCQGALNDYCRWVGRGNDSYFSCALAGRESPYTLPGQVTEQFANSAPCQETGYRSQALTDLTCVNGDVSEPWDNNCRNRQCCKAKCDSNPACTGFVFGNSANNNCRTAGDGQNCCWLKGGECRSVFNPLMSAWQKASPGKSCWCSSFTLTWHRWLHVHVNTGGVASCEPFHAASGCI